MQIEIRIDHRCKDTKVIVVTDKVTDKINTLIKKLSEDTTPIIAGFQGETLKILDQQNIFRIFASNGKVFAETDHGEYQLRLRLYEIEERLDHKVFIRISNSEIINLKKVKGFDLTYTGTICVSFLNGTTAYVSRRQIKKIKQVLGI